jgi:hypothetical protein
VISTTTRATITLSPTDLGSTCSGSLDIEYYGNDWYDTNSDTSITISVIKHPVTVQTIEYKQGTFNTFQPTYPTLTVGSNLEMRVQVSASEPGYSQIPNEYIEVWMEDSSGPLDPKDTSPTYTISEVPGVTYFGGTNYVYRVMLDANGHALFTWNFEAAATGLSLKYRYAGDDKFAAGSTLSADNLSFVDP